MLSLRKSKFVRNVAIVASGTALAQIINLMATPFITRIYGPEAFGALGSFTAVLSLLATASALSYPIAIVLPDNEKDAIGLVRLSFVLTIVSTVVVSTISVIWYQPILEFLGLENLGSNIFFIVPGIVGAGLMSIASHWLIRHHRFYLDARIKVIQAIWVNLAKIGFGIIWPAATSLIAIASITTFIHSILVIKFDRSLASIFFHPAKMVEWRKSRREIHELSREYSMFPLYRTPQNILNSLSQNIPIFLLGGLFGLQSVGFYVLARSVLTSPVQLIGNSVRTVFYARFSSAKNNKERLQSILLKAITGLIVIGTLPFGILFLWGPVLFTFVFGESWESAGEYSRWLGMWVFAGLVNCPCNAAVSVLSLERELLVYEFVYAATRASGMYIAYLAGCDALQTLICFTVIGVTFNAIFIFTVILFVNKHDENTMARSTSDES